MPFTMSEQGLNDLPFNYGDFEVGAQRQNALDSQSLANVYQRLMNERQAAMNPLDIAVRQKDAALAGDEMNNPEYRQWRVRGMTGESKSKAATGDYDQAVLKDKIQNGLAKFKAETSESEYKTQLSQMDQLHTFLQSSIPELEALPEGMMRNAKLVQLARDFGVNPKVAEKLVTGRSGGNIEALKKLQASLGYALENTTEQRKKLTEKELDMAKSVEVANISADASRDVANIHASSSRDVADKNSEKEAAKLKIENDVRNLINEKFMQPNTWTPQKEQYLQYLQQHLYTLKALTAPSAMDSSQFNLGVPGPAEKARQAVEGQGKGQGTTIKYDNKGNRIQ